MAGLGAVAMTKAPRFSPYPRYKDSGFEAVSQIPQHWSAFALRRELFRQPAAIKIGPFGSELKLEDMSSEGFKVYGQEHVISRDFHRGSKYINAVKFAELSACEIRPGDLMVTMMGSSGHCAVVPPGVERGLMDSHLLRIRLPRRRLEPVFVQRLIEDASYVRDQVITAGKGAIMHGLNSEIVKSLIFAVPPLDEQRQIVVFVDRETAKIDALIAKKRRVIELLNEKRRAFITCMISGGSDHDDALVKSSAIDWLTAIPAAWETKPLKRLASFVTSGSRGWAEFYADDGPLFLRIGNVGRDTIDLDLVDVQHVRPPHGAESDRTLVRPNDVLISVTAMIGAVGVIPDTLPVAYVNQHLALVRPISSAVEPRWLAFCLLSSVGQSQMAMSLYGGAKDGLSLEDVKSLVILVPPMAVQRSVVSAIAGECRRIDLLTAKIREGILKLEERRASLISAVVSGKIDVRGEAS